MDSCHRVCQLVCPSADSVHAHSAIQEEYLKWAKENDFVSMLPKDCKQRKESAAAAAVQQTRLDSHLQPVVAKPKPTPYSDQLFHEAAIQWLVNTDQVGHVQTRDFTLF